MLVVENVSKSFNDRPVLKEVSFHVNPGELVGLVGPTGGGKSVLLKIVGGVMEPDSGCATFADKPCGSADSRVGFLFQEGALFDSQTVLENVAFPLTQIRDGTGAVAAPQMSRSEAYDKAYELLTEVGLADAAMKVPGQLSGGMRRRVGIARALAPSPEIVPLDDPTGGLDPVAASVIMNLIENLHQHYSPAVLVVSHDIRRLLPKIDRVLGLFGGQISCDLPPRRLRDEASPDVVRFLATRFDFSAFS